MPQRTVTLPTPDGSCPASIFHPEGAGPWPAVLLFMDGIGIRPALFAMGERLASYGYFVLLPDLLYRAGPYTAPDARTLFSDPKLRKPWIAKYLSTVTTPNVMKDTRVFLDFLSAQTDVVQSLVGATGYCMGGGFALAAAGHFPDRIAAAASFHGGDLATDEPDSPHLQAPHIKARVYVAGAVEDRSFPDDMKQRLVAAFDGAGVRHTVETYEGARHGWVPADTAAHNPAAAERHWETLEKLLSETL